MPLISLPIEIIAQIFSLLDECEPINSYWVENNRDMGEKLMALRFLDERKLFDWAEKHKDMCETLMALRLTCKQLDGIATRQLFRTFCLSPSWESWMKFHSIAHSQKLRGHVQTLAFDRHPDRNDIHSWEEWDTCAGIYQQKMATVPDSPVFRAVDLSLLPNLKVLRAEDKWVITKMARSSVKIPFGHCQVRAISIAGIYQQADFWTVLTELAEITHYGFQVFLLICRLGLNSPWKCPVNIDLSGLRSLRLYFKASFGNNHDPPADLNLSAQLQHLPNLEEFYLNQMHIGRFNKADLMLRSAINVFGQLRVKKWPRLRHLDLRFRVLATTVAEFQAFVAPHAGMLKTFHMYTGNLNAQVLEDEKEQRDHLLHWIQTEVCPPGGGAEFTHL